MDLQAATPEIVLIQKKKKTKGKSHPCPNRLVWGLRRGWGEPYEIGKQWGEF